MDYGGPSSCCGCGMYPCNTGQPEHPSKETPMTPWEAMMLLGLEPYARSQLQPTFDPIEQAQANKEYSTVRPDTSYTGIVAPSPEYMPTFDPNESRFKFGEMHANYALIIRKDNHVYFLARDGGLVSAQNGGRQVGFYRKCELPFLVDELSKRHVDCDRLVIAAYDVGYTLVQYVYDRITPANPMNPVAPAAVPTTAMFLPRETIERMVSEWNSDITEYIHVVLTERGIYLRRCDGRYNTITGGVPQNVQEYIHTKPDVFGEESSRMFAQTAHWEIHAKFNLFGRFVSDAVQFGDLPANIPADEVLQFAKWRLVVSEARVLLDNLYLNTVVQQPKAPDAMVRMYAVVDGDRWIYNDKGEVVKSNDERDEVRSYKVFLYTNIHQDVRNMAAKLNRHPDIQKLGADFKYVIWVEGDNRDVTLQYVRKVTSEKHITTMHIAGMQAGLPVMYPVLANYETVYDQNVDTQVFVDMGHDYLNQVIDMVFYNLHDKLMLKPLLSEVTLEVNYNGTMKSYSFNGWMASKGIHPARRFIRSTPPITDDQLKAAHDAIQRQYEHAAESESQSLELKVPHASEIGRKALRISHDDLVAQLNLLLSKPCYVKPIEDDNYGLKFSMAGTVSEQTLEIVKKKMLFRGWELRVAYEHVPSNHPFTHFTVVEKEL